MTPQEVAQAGRIKGLTMRCEKLEDEANKWAEAYRQAKESAQEQQSTIATQAAAIEALREAAKWISVEDRLPPNLPDMVITYNASQKSVHASCGDFVLASAGEKWFGITHWMPLPTPPADTGADHDR